MELEYSYENNAWGCRLTPGHAGGYVKFMQKKPPMPIDQKVPAGRKISVIFVTRKNGSQFFINPELFKQIVSRNPCSGMVLY